MSQTEANQLRIDDIKAEIESAGERCSYPTLDLLWLRSHGALDKQFNHNNFLSEIATLECFHELAYYRDLRPEGSRGGAVPFIKRVMRKLIKFLLFPIVQDQNRINANLMRSMRHVRVHVNGQLDRNQRLAQENEMLKERVTRLEEWMDAELARRRNAETTADTRQTAAAGKEDKPCA